MVPCLVLGDSIAIGIGQYLPECRTEARVGISSQQFAHALLSPQEAGRVVISLGVNDGASAATIPSLRQVRQSVHGKSVYWLLPANHDHARTAIRAVAAEFGDRLIDTAPQVGSDGLHPTGAGYRALAQMVGTGAEPGQPGDRRPLALPTQIAQVRPSASATSGYWQLSAYRDNPRPSIKAFAASGGYGTIYAPTHIGPNVVHPTGSGYHTLAKLGEPQAGPKQPGDQTPPALPGQIVPRRLGG